MDRRRSNSREVDEEQEIAQFQQRHRTFSDRVERVLMQLVILGLVALALVQTLEVMPTFRRVANVVEGLEGVPWREVASWKRSGSADHETSGKATPAGAVRDSLTVTVVLISQRSAPQAKLLVDGKPAGSFTSASLTTAVTQGQSLAVDGTGTTAALTFRVVGATGLASPALGTEVVTRGTRQSLGSVRSAN